MRAVRLARPDGHKETGIALEGQAHVVRNEGLEMQRSAHVVIPGCLASLAAAEWLRSGGASWGWAAAAAGLAGLAGVTGLGALRERTPRALARGAAGLGCLALGATLVAGAVEVRQVECCWPALRERRVARASVQLAATLAAAATEAQRLAAGAAAAAALPQRAAFDALRRTLRHGVRGTARLERGVVVLAQDGEPWAWAGRHRFVPVVDTGQLRVVITPFYVSLEARRQTQGVGTAVGTVLLDARVADPDRDRALSTIFAREQGVDLHFFPSRVALAGSAVLTYTTPQGDTLFRVEAVPPRLDDARLATRSAATRRVAATLAGTLLLLLLAALPGAGRWTAVLVGAWCLVRASTGVASPRAGFFSPATFHRSLLGGFTSSAGALTVLAGLLLVAAGVLWRRGPPRRWWSVAGAALLLLAAPFLVRNLGRGITPPTQGVSIALWLSWEAALAVASMALIFLAAALLRGPEEPRRVPWTLPAAAAWAVLAALAGLWLWQPNGAWPEWYTYVWLPALVGVVVPAPRRWAVVAIATVAGTAAALVTWDASVEGRLALAERDARTLGATDDSLAATALQRLGAAAESLPAPRTAGDLYTLWRRSPLAATEYPTVLSVWTPAGEPEAELRLAALDLPPPLVAALVRSPATARGPRVERVATVPGVDYLLIAPVHGGAVLAVGVGPRSRLVPSSRLTRFLHGEQPLTPPYTISLSLPGQAPAAASRAVTWTRVGWAARGEYLVELPGGVRHVHLRADLGGPWPLLVRGALVVAVDAALLAGCWMLGAGFAAGWRPRIPPLLAALRSSYRLRLAAALAAFFVLPVIAFAWWSFTRFSAEAREASDLRIRQTLQDAAGAASGLSLDRAAAVRQAVAELGTRLDADLWVYRDGVLWGSSTPVLDELGLVDPYLPAPAFEHLALEDELELAADGTTAGRPIRIGYRVVVAGPPRSEGILAVPQLLDDEGVRQEQEGLALTLLAAAGAGVIAAGYLAGLAARALARPVGALREAAVAVGRGAPLPAFPPGAPREFEPVMTAFERMAADVRSSQAALEEARRRTAQVLANVATGVIAVDGGLRVTLANPRAAELVGSALEPGTVLPRTVADDWVTVWNAVADFIAHRPGDIREREFTINGRQIRVQLAPLGPEPDGCVVALDDATALTRAARVLAWGEMARQVAHEIKNPLTPIRLGIQHLQRARRRADFDVTLRDTATRILAEIDRLDAIARTFSRFGSPAAEGRPLELVDLYAVAREVVQLYVLGGVPAAAQFELIGASGPPVQARRDEVKEVLVNLLENARNANARRVAVRVSADGCRVTIEDDGRGIPSDLVPRVFEPAFSSTSSGSGLGLAIAKRLVDSWGGAIALTSTLGAGTTVTISLVEAGSAMPR